MHRGEGKLRYKQSRKLGIQQGHRRRDPSSVLNKSVHAYDGSTTAYGMIEESLRDETEITKMSDEYKLMNESMNMSVSQFGLVKTAKDNFRKHAGRLGAVTIAGI